MKAKRIFALVLTLVMILMSSACTTKIEVLIGDGAVAVGGTGNAGGAGGAGGTGGSGVGGASGGDSVTVPTDEGGDEASKEAGLETKEDIVQFYVDAYNKMSEGTVTKTYDYTSNYNNILNIDGGNKVLQGVAGTLMGMFMVENTEAHKVDFTNDVPPRGVGTLSIDPNLIANATSKDMGDYFEVSLYSTGTDSNYEIDSQPGTGSAGSFAPLLRTEDVSGAAAGYIEFEGLQSWYATATVTAHITKDGKITFLEFFTPCILHFDKVSAVKIVNVGACEVGLLFHQKFSITY